MKIVLLNNYGGRIPRALIPDIAGKDVSWRWGNIIDKIERMAVAAENPSSETAKVVRYFGADAKTKTYLFRDENITVSIVDVDIRRPWTIVQYDGAEIVQYLDYTVISKAMNYCTLP